jgi:phosphatidylinositol alpha-1,6-mannosyltransferase
MGNGDESARNLRFLVFADNYRPEIGGIAEHAYKVAKHLSRRTAHVVVLARAYGGDDESGCDHGGPVYRVRRTPFFSWFSYTYIAARLIRRHDIDVVYNVTGYPCGIISWFLSFFLRFRYTITTHAHEVVYSMGTPRQVLKALLKRWQVAVMNRADKVFAVSDFTRRTMIEAGVVPERIALIYNGVDLSDFEEHLPVAETLEKYRLAGKRVILTVARLDVHKGHDLVIQAMSRILERVPGAVYAIVGGGKMERPLRRLVRSEGLEQHVIFTGVLPRKQVLALLKICDVFVMVSRQVITDTEGFGIVFLEASAMKKPVLGGRSGGIPDAVKDGVSGFLVDPGDSNAIAEVILRLLEDHQLASRLGLRGYEMVRERFTWDKVVDRILAGIGHRLVGR